MTPELLPCPFGCKGLVVANRNGFDEFMDHVPSDTFNPCPAHGTWKRDKWNRRTPDLTEALARLKALEERMRQMVWGDGASKWADEIAAIRNKLEGK